ncbi:MAG: aminodeoxychorismate synthase component I [Bacteroidales bacterium]|nr:aminodeoxychorismate synthase component I [Bacteroidales bacterium]
MIYSKTEAIDRMNEWGTGGIPFLFLIDFEMKAIRLHRLDINTPADLHFSFHEDASDTSKDRHEYIFIKHPVSFSEYEKAFNQIQDEILAGNSFLLNLTFPTPIETNLTLEEIYRFSRAPYKILFENHFVCFSPESFITIRDGMITTSPMKGTINASMPGAEQLLLANAKETAEHHTVVDLLRNDLSRVAREVTVKRFRYLGKIETNNGAILQASSEITGKLPENYHCMLGSIVFAMLPAGSVSGAPKEKTLEIIRKTEKADRGYYTGICGIFDGRNLDSAVMIRMIEMNDGMMRFRSGGGITFLSNAREEFEELIEKVYVPLVYNH